MPAMKTSEPRAKRAASRGSHGGALIAVLLVVCLLVGLAAGILARALTGQRRGAAKPARLSPTRPVKQKWPTDSGAFVIKTGEQAMQPAPGPIPAELNRKDSV